MQFLTLTLLSCLLNVYFADQSPTTQAHVSASIATKSISINEVKNTPTNFILQSTDGGRTWQDISQGLPEKIQPEDFFAGESDVYLRVNGELYRSKSNLKVPVWEKEHVPDPRSASIAFMRSGVIAYNEAGQIFQKTPATEIWLPIYSTFKNHSVQTIFETSDGIILVGCLNGLYKSVDGGKSWKQVQQGGWVMDMAESDGVLIATSQAGITRSTDGGERWERVISEGGVGIAVERIKGGFAAISYSTSAQSRRIRISLDQGKTWQAIDGHLMPSLSISSIRQIGNTLVCGHPDGIFRSTDMGQTWSIVHPSVNYEVKLGLPNYPSADNRKVFRLYVSGNVVYAVANDSGC